MIRAQKLKSVFSTIGVFIGVTFLIGAWSIVNGMNRYMTEKFAGTLVGVNTFHLRRSPHVNFDVQDSVWRSWRRRPRIKFADANAVTQHLTVPVVTAWYSEDRGSVEYNGKVAKDITLEGATERYFDIMNLQIADGPPFTPQESKAGITVVVLGYDLAHKLFPDVNPIGHSVRIHGFPYRVIGVVERQGNLLGISLVVGGIVIMNIMLMAVAERTREIGIRKSLGARRRDILRQFLAEATALATVGAALGIVTGVGLSVLLQAVSPLPASVSPFSIVLGVVVGGGVGVVAGVYPASRAARLEPITALRQE